MKDIYPKDAHVPEDVYHRAIWTIRGYDRMLSIANDTITTSPVNDGMPHPTQTSDPTFAAVWNRRKYMKIIAAVDHALLELPQPARKIIFEHVAHRVSIASMPGADAYSTEQWKRHKLHFIEAVARRTEYEED